ncbi:MAG: hypothetical protein GY703_08450 [Gammaproteobacteria bacterium]|nr:hypothetical protein [Gammaproteobacteria bacterium]
MQELLGFIWAMSLQLLLVMAYAIALLTFKYAMVKGLSAMRIITGQLKDHWVASRIPSHTAP